MENVKYRLQKYSDLKYESDQIRERINSIKEKMTSISTQSFDEIIACPSESDKIGEMIATLSDLETIYIDKLNRLMQELIYIEKLIDKLDPQERVIIRKRYLDCKRWEDVCVEINCSWRNTHRKHRAILTKLDKLA